MMPNPLAPAGMVLEGRTAIVTGGASGIGRAAVERFARAGATVICADLDGFAARTWARSLEEAGLSVHGIRTDVIDEGSVAEMAQVAMDRTGRIDSVVANAGAMVEGDLLSLSLADWNRAMNVNATGSFLTARAVMAALIKTRGTLVLTASTVGLAGMKGVAAYSASKGAVVALTRQLAAEYADCGVRVNAVAPGAVRTPLSESQFRARARDDAHFEELLAQVIGRYPLSRWGTPEEIAEVLLFLAAPTSSWMTGQIVPVEGGLLELR